MENKSKLNTVLLVIIIILLILGLVYIFFNNSKQKEENNLLQKNQIPVGDTKDDADQSELNSNTITYQNHGFIIELPKGFIPKEEQLTTGPVIRISMPVGSLGYVTDSSFWEKSTIPSYTYVKDQKIGETTFKVYTYSGATFYWFKKGNVGYEFGGTDTVGLEKLIKTFKFTGWTQN